MNQWQDNVSHSRGARPLLWLRLARASLAQLRCLAVSLCVLIACDATDAPVYETNGPEGTKYQGGLCARCVHGDECQSHSCLRNDFTGEHFCGSDCADGCPAGYVCQSIRNIPNVLQCAPISGSCSAP